jgi:hypothetical protein
MYEKAEYEKYMAVVFYNHEMFKSNELVFTNKDPIPEEATMDTGDLLIFEHQENSLDDYQIYTITNYLFDGADETKVRRIRCRYDGLLAKDNAFVNGYIYWIVPKVSTMLDVDVDDLVNNRGFVLDDTKSTFDFRLVSFGEGSGKQYEKNMYYQKIVIDAEKNLFNYVVSEAEAEDKPEGDLYEKVCTEQCFYK